MKDRELDNLSKLVNSSVAVAAGGVLAGALSLLTRMILGRLLQPEKYGVLNEGLAFMNFLITFSLLGMFDSIARYASHDEDIPVLTSSALSVILPLSLVSAILLYTTSGWISSWMGSPGLQAVLKILSLNLPASIMSIAAIAEFRGRKRTLERVTITQILMPVYILLASTSLVLLSPSAEYAAVAYASSAWISLLAAAYFYRRRGFKLAKPSLSKIRELIDFSYPLWISNLSGLGIVWVNVIIIGYILSSTETGLYNAVFPITYSMSIILSSLGYLYLPLMSSLHSQDRKSEMVSLYETVVRWIVTIITPIIIVFLLKPRTVIKLLFGSSYTSAAGLLAILSIGRFVQNSVGPVGAMLIAFGSTRKEALTQLIGLILITTGSMVMLPRIGLLGAGISYAVGISTANILRLIFTRKYAPFNPLSADYWKQAAAALIAAVVLLLPVSGIVLNLGVITVSLLTYAVVLLSLKPFKEEDIYSIEQMLEKNSISGTDKIVKKLRRFEE